MMLPPARLSLLFAAFGLSLLLSDPGLSTRTVAEQEELACARCHRGRQTAERLSDLGLYFQMMRTVEGYDRLTERFSRCTSCHRERAGSPELTETGRRYQWFFEDMDGIRAWVMNRHPTAPVVTTGQPAKPNERDEKLSEAAEGDEDG